MITIMLEGITGVMKVEGGNYFNLVSTIAVVN
jgi:hypothetical protein